MRDSSPDTTPATATGALPIEDLGNGLYLHRDIPERGMPGGVKVTTIEESSGETRYLVDAVQFMEMQRDRDELRKALALINAWRRTPGRSEQTLAGLLANVGFDDADADAMRGIVAQFNPDALT